MKYVLRLLIFWLLASFYGFSQGLELVKSYPTDPFFKAIEYTTNGEMYVSFDYNSTNGATPTGCATNSINNATFIAKLDKNKNCLWSLPFSWQVTINQMVTDNAGNLIMIGSVSVPSGYTGKITYC